jgi:hypothetical protein
MMETHNNDFSIVVFPFLKTEDAVSLGDITFQSTDDTEGLSPEQAGCVKELANMLFLKDNLRIKSASYAIVPFIDLSSQLGNVEYFMNVQAFVAYIYASPRHSFGDLFLSSEHASIVIFTPGRVPISVVHPDFHVIEVEPSPDLVPDHRHEIEGYTGIYNFKHYFWVAKGSRVYGPVPHPTLNSSQDLNFDLSRNVAVRADYRLLRKLLGKPKSQTYSRIFTAVRWFNAANNEASDQNTAIVNLSIAFEALLSLPADGKTERLIDSISLLLGRVPRLDIWVHQFYDARSHIVHEGYAQQLRFIATNSQKGNEGPQYQSLLSYGRRIFQLCLATLLVGIELSEDAGLEETLVTNQERFQKISEILADGAIPPEERLKLIAPIVSATEQYQFVPEDDLKIESLIGAVRLAAKNLLENEKTISEELSRHLKQMTEVKRTADHFQELDTLQALNNLFRNKSEVALSNGGQVVSDLVEVVWEYVFMAYFRLKKQLEDKKPTRRS